jgi:hypothetical protein
MCYNSHKKIGRNLDGFSQFTPSEWDPRDGLSYFLRVVFLAVLLVTDFLAAFLAVAFLAAGFLVFLAPVLFLTVFFLVTGIHTPPFLSAIAVHVKIM